jgi:hypothetical protein
MTKAMTLEVLEPSGTVEPWAKNAPRIGTLEGKTICELWNGAWRGDEIMPLLRDLLQKRLPTAKIIPYTNFPVGTPQLSDAKLMSKVVKEAGCDAVIAGMSG